MNGSYKINEIFYSLQGEGLRSGTANIFIRFSGCNLTCNYCDTEFESGKQFSTTELLAYLQQEKMKGCKQIIFTGGEPALQVDTDLIKALKDKGYYLAIETNGSKQLPEGLDFITVSPKVAEHVIRRNFKQEIDELKYIIAKDQQLPTPQAKAKNYFISPMSDGDQINIENLDYCIELVRNNPEWKLTMQYHKIWKLR